MLCLGGFELYSRLVPLVPQSVKTRTCKLWRVNLAYMFYHWYYLRFYFLSLLLPIIWTWRCPTRELLLLWTYPGPRGFSWFFLAKEINSKPRSGDNESRKRRGEREKPLVTLTSNLTSMQTTGSGSDPRALIGWYFFKRANQFDWLV